jgi:membrane protein
VVFSAAQQLIERISASYDSAVAWMRKRSALFDHFWRTKDRYGDVLGGRLSAAIAYYGYFAFFALAVVVYTVLLDVISGSAGLTENVDSFLRNYFTEQTIELLKDQAGLIRPIGMIALIMAGIGWVDSWRSSLRAIWGLDQHPGNFLVLRAVDLGTLIVFGLTMGVSIGINDGLEWVFREIAGPATDTLPFHLATYGLSLLINVVIGFGLMTILPRMHLTLKRLIPPVIVIGLGLTLLNFFSTYLIGRTERNPAYVIVASTVGLLTYLYLFNQIVLWAAAWAATAQNGRVFDLAWGKPREHDTLKEGDLSHTEKP